MKKNRVFTWLQFWFCMLLISLFQLNMSCKKGWLDAKPQKALVVPRTIRDYQAMLDGTTNTIAFNGDQNSLDETAAGDFYVSPATLAGATRIEVNSYRWAPDIYEDAVSSIEWDRPYQQIFYTNVVLEGLAKITPSNSAEQLEWNQVKGSALFFRAYSHYDIARLFCTPYNSSTANADLGIPLRLQSDFNVPSARSTVKQTYEQITTDLKAALDLLPIDKPINSVYQLRPTKTAALGMLARVYLAMSEYDSASVYSDKTLKLYNALMDYNDSNWVNKNANATKNFQKFNPEVIFSKQANNWSLLGSSRLIVDSNLLELYHPTNDLRRSLAFFRTASGNVNFKGSYNDLPAFMGGLATDEMYLIRSECNARKGDTATALADLNALLIKRWKTGTFTRVTATSASDALKKILVERRKELCFRCIRWTDLRRLNREPQFAVTLTKVVNGSTYTLPPNSPLYVFPIPPNVIRLTGMTQNPR